jgi:4-amino-4-deoxy-L-arabinose transferase-like glycosyltransferase
VSETPAPHPASVPPARAAPSPPSAAGVWLIALVGWTTFMCFYHLGGGARFEPIDCWVAQTAREMREAGDWLMPRFSGETRMQKSPGPYWAVMATSLLRGTAVDEVSARLPNAVAAVVLVVTIFWLTRRIGGDRAAVFAGFAASSSVLVLWWSHRAASDLGLTTCTTLSLAALWIASETEVRGRRQNLLWLLGYFAAGLGMLYKMPMPLVVVGLPAVCYIVLRNRWSILWSRWHLAGLLLFLLPWLPWAVAVCFHEDAAFAKWRVEFLDRFTGALPNVAEPQKWWHYFTYLGPPVFYCLPFTLSLPMALGRAFRKQPGVHRNGQLFLAIWFLSLLAFFTASAGKEWRYFLPALPPLFVLLGIELAALFDRRRRLSAARDWAGAIGVWVGTPVVLLAGGLPVLWRWYKARGQSELEGLSTWSDVWQAYLVAAAIAVAGFGLAAWWYRRRREHVSFGAIVVTMWVMWLWVWPNLMPLMMSQRSHIDFAEQLADPERVPLEYRPYIANVGSQDSRIIWYSDIRIPRVIDQLDLLEEQAGRRDLQYEIRRTGEVLLEKLAGEAPALFVVALPDYVQILLAAPEELARLARPMPPLHLWLQSRHGPENRHYVLFGNRPPPFPEPELRVPPKLHARLEAAGRRTAPEEAGPVPSASQPAPQHTNSD